ncbi:tetratricopeptide repeat protein [Cohnella sp. LGH]|uniref:tetratricopeptide repeat protein n=1 Tax=Cohnella sp. LGH TaxID=1619153 RepID=UPI001ADCDA8C|nr:tetratricopeptide repeat protein [Cohnella sp. LGH]QTH45129.1 tetratricopeptide repeat protein [Cohnella sp. LGH]
MLYRIARWMAKRLSKQRKLRQSIRWHERWGIERMTLQERVDYAMLLHDYGKTEQAVEFLTSLLKERGYSKAYERRAHIFNEMGREEEAIADLDAAIKLDPEPSIVWYTRAISHNNRGDFELAARDFQEALLRREDSKASTYYELGNVYMKMGSYEEAEAAFASACSDAGNAIPHYYFRHAQAFEMLDRMDEAAQTLAEATKLQKQWRDEEQQGAANYRARTNYSPTAIDTLIRTAEEEYGFLLYESKLREAAGDIESALASIREATEQYSPGPDLQLRRGQLLRLLDRPQEAQEALERLVADYPTWLPGHMELSALLRSQDRPDEAVRVLLETKRRYPEHPVVRYWLADAYRESGQGDEALQENEELTELEPDDPLNWKQRAEILIDAAKYRDADAAYTQSLQLEQSAECYMRRSYSRYMEERYEEAMLDIQAAAELDSNLLKESKTAYAMAELYMGMGNHELADSEYSRALALEPDNPQIYDRRARCRFAAERWEAALEDCDRGLQLTGANPRLTWLRGLIQYRMEDLDGALHEMTAYTDLVPDDAQGFYNLGHIYNHLNRPDDAIAAFSKTIELSPFDAQAYLERASIWYHHYFDRTRAVDDLAQWLLYAETRARDGDRFELLSEVKGFDDEMRERAKDQFLRVYGSSQYLS